MNSEKKIKKNTPQIKKNEVVFSNNVMKPSPNINNIVLKSSLATKNEEININNSNFEESKKKVISKEIFLNQTLQIEFSITSKRIII